MIKGGTTKKSDNIDISQSKVEDNLNNVIVRTLGPNIRQF